MSALALIEIWHRSEGIRTIGPAVRDGRFDARDIVFPVTARISRNP
jgi:hypothetical protein